MGCDLGSHHSFNGWDYFYCPDFRTLDQRRSDFHLGVDFGWFDTFRFTVCHDSRTLVSECGKSSNLFASVCHKIDFVFFVIKNGVECLRPFFTVRECQRI